MRKAIKQSSRNILIGLLMISLVFTQMFQFSSVTQAQTFELAGENIDIPEDANDLESLIPIDAYHRNTTFEEIISDHRTQKVDVIDYLPLEMTNVQLNFPLFNAIFTRVEEDLGGSGNPVLNYVVDKTKHDPDYIHSTINLDLSSDDDRNYDDVNHPAAAVSNNGTVLEIHESEAGNWYYNLGSVKDDNRIEWFNPRNDQSKTQGTRYSAGSGSGGQGYNKAVFLTDDIVLMTSVKNHKLAYNLAKINGKSIDFDFEGGSYAQIPGVKDYDDQVHGLSVNKHGDIVVFYQTGDGSNLHYVVGKYNKNNHNISWGNDHNSLMKGWNPTIALTDSGEIVVAHNANLRSDLHYSIGSLNTSNKTIDWLRKNVSYGKGWNPSIAVTNGGTVIQVHQGESKNEIYYKVGQLAGDEINWNKRHGATKYNSGQKPFVTLVDDGRILELHRASSGIKGYFSINHLTTESGKVLVMIDPDSKLAENSFLTLQNQWIKVQESGTDHEGRGPKLVYEKEKAVGIAESEAYSFATSTGLSFTAGGKVSFAGADFSSSLTKNWSETLTESFGTTITITEKDKTSNSYEPLFTGIPAKYAYYQLIRSFEVESGGNLNKLVEKLHEYPSLNLSRNAAFIPQQVDYDTKTIVPVIRRELPEGLIQNEEVVTFERSSHAYNDDFEISVNDVPRFNEHGLIIENKAVNLWKDPLELAHADYGKADSLTYEKHPYERFLNGDSVLEVTAANSNDYMNRTFDVDPNNKTYTFSVWLKADQPHDVSLRLRSQGNQNSGNGDNDEIHTFQVTTEWERYEVTESFDESADWLRTTIYPAGYYLDTGSIYMWGPQVEELQGRITETSMQNATSFVDGERDADVLTLNNEDEVFMNDEEFTIEATVIPNNLYNYSDIFVAHNEGLGNRQTTIFYNLHGKIYFRSVGQTNEISSDEGTVVPGQLLHVAMTYKYDSGLGLYVTKAYVDGQLIGETTTSYTPDIDEILHIGSRNDGKSQLNGTFVEFRLSNIARDESDIRKAYNNGFSVDDQTIVYMDFQGHLDVQTSKPVNIYLPNNYLEWNKTNDLDIYESDEIAPFVNKKVYKLEPKELNKSVQYTVDINPQRKLLTFGIWLKADKNHKAQIKIKNRDDSDKKVEVIDVTTEWEYYEVSLDEPLQLSQDGRNGVTVVLRPGAYNGTTDPVYAWGASLKEHGRAITLESLADDLINSIEEFQESQDVTENTNLLQSPNDFIEWQAGGIVVEEFQAELPDGDVTFQKLTPEEVNRGIQQRIDINLEGKLFTFGIWLRAEREHEAQIKIQNKDNSDSKSEIVYVTTEWEYYEITLDEPLKLSEDGRNGVTVVLWPGAYNGTTDPVYAHAASLTQREYGTINNLERISARRLASLNKGVVFYRYIDYEGEWVLLQEGEYPSLNDIQLGGFTENPSSSEDIFTGTIGADDRLSSLITDGNYKITLYEDENFGGNVVTYYEDVANFRNDNINDKVSSIKMEPIMDIINESQPILNLLNTDAHYIEFGIDLPQVEDLEVENIQIYRDGKWIDSLASSTIDISNFIYRDEGIIPDATHLYEVMANYELVVGNTRYNYSPEKGTELEVVAQIPAPTLQIAGSTGTIVELLITADPNTELDGYRIYKNEEFLEFIRTSEDEITFSDQINAEKTTYYVISVNEDGEWSPKSNEESIEQVEPLHLEPTNILQSIDDFSNDIWIKGSWNYVSVEDQGIINTLTPQNDVNSQIKQKFVTNHIVDASIWIRANEEHMAKISITNSDGIITSKDIQVTTEWKKVELDVNHNQSVEAEFQFSIKPDIEEGTRSIDVFYPIVRTIQ
ncbi:phage head spike fiber domain-containing protein [Chengkuizengella axinellae]|uniref:LamG-like jellyroll fold domain-containing protein n=1 Tax=Chengkuizengella axinellae TaxID=3064388 RepID=A0ABT9IXS7_9BACL|nr:LamG-like jellyroll fold domain-containing protein [Chengkuizengella sp. 2205SS18-9]MDP5274165.1 LamG-like jellyroll fold domain-containing protein [Chengkuizengella sp. 2205SS18-9]